MILDFLSSPRLKSFYWRTLAMALAGFLAIVGDSLEMFHLSSQVAVVVGLILGELTKAINNWIDDKPLGFANTE